MSNQEQLPAFHCY